MFLLLFLFTVLKSFFFSMKLKCFSLQLTVLVAFFWEGYGMVSIYRSKGLLWVRAVFIQLD